MVLDIFCIIQIIQLIKRDSRQNRKNMIGQFHVKQILKMCFTNKKNYHWKGLKLKWGRTSLWLVFILLDGHLSFSRKENMSFVCSITFITHLGITSFVTKKAFEPQWTVKEKHYCTCTFLTFLLVLSFFIWSCILFEAMPHWGDFQSVQTKRFLCCQVPIIRKISHTPTVIHSRNDRCVIFTHMQLNWF